MIARRLIRMASAPIPRLIVRLQLNDQVIRMDALPVVAEMGDVLLALHCLEGFVDSALGDEHQSSESELVAVDFAMLVRRLPQIDLGIGTRCRCSCYYAA